VKLLTLHVTACLLTCWPTVLRAECADLRGCCGRKCSCGTHGCPLTGVGCGDNCPSLREDDCDRAKQALWAAGKDAPEDCAQAIDAAKKLPAPASAFQSSTPQAPAQTTEVEPATEKPRHQKKQKKQTAAPPQAGLDTSSSTLQKMIEDVKPVQNQPEIRTTNPLDTEYYPPDWSGFPQFGPTGQPSRDPPQKLEQTVSEFSPTDDWLGLPRPSLDPAHNSEMIKMGIDLSTGAIGSKWADVGVVAFDSVWDGTKAALDSNGDPNQILTEFFRSAIAGTTASALSKWLRVPPGVKPLVDVGVGDFIKKQLPTYDPAANAKVWTDPSLAFPPTAPNMADGMRFLGNGYTPSPTPAAVAPIQNVPQGDPSK